MYNLSIHPRSQNRSILINIKPPKKILKTTSGAAEHNLEKYDGLITISIYIINFNIK